MARISLNSEEFKRQLKMKNDQSRSGLENIPEEMRSFRQWVGFVLPSKNPIDPATLSDARSNDPETWSDYEEARASIGRTCQYYDGKKMQTGEIAGIGFMLTDSDPFVCVDLDHVLTNRKVSGEAQEIFEKLSSYTEVSSSGSGLHIFVKGSKPGTKCKKSLSEGDIEMYSRGRYIAMTGDVFENKYRLSDRNSEIRYIYTTYLEDKKKTPETGSQETGSILDDTTLLKKARTMGDAQKMFVDLFDNGDMSKFENDHSRADNALVSILAFWTRDDATQIDRLFRQSKLMRDKWDRETSGSTYGAITIQNVISKPHKTYKGSGRVGSILGEESVKKEEFLTLDILRAYLKENEIAVKYNELTDETDVIGLDKQYRGQENGVLPVLLNDKLKPMYKGVTKKNIEDMLTVIRVENRFNPVRRYLNNLTWDQKDYLSEIYDILGLTDPLDKTFVRKWFIQCVAMAYNGESELYGADGVLVLQGSQGIGKTSFFRLLTPRPDWFREGLDLNIYDKDVVIKATTAWISELGEFDATTKRDQRGLKAFITNTKDNVRKPYAPTAVDKIRCTSFCATVNEDTFLRDKTGARRWWIVKIKNEKLMPSLLEFTKNKKNISGLWAQIVEIYKKNPTGFRLTGSERTELNDRNSEKLIETPTESALMDYLDFDAPDDQWDWWTASELKQFGGLIDALRGSSVVDIGKAITTLSMYNDKIVRGTGRNRRSFYLPIVNRVRSK